MNRKVLGPILLSVIGFTLILMAFFSQTLVENYFYWQYQILPEKQDVSRRFSYELMALLNDHRLKNNLSALNTNYFLCSYAFIRAKETVNEWSHEGFKRNLLLGMYDQTGEALAREFKTPEEVLNGWLKSSPHRQIVEGNYNLGCVGVYIKEGTVFYVALEVARREKN